MLTIKEKRLVVVLGAIVLVVGGIVVYNQLGNSGIKIEKNSSSQQLSSSTKTKGNEQKKQPPKTILVHLGGAVAKPGVYECQAGSRLYKVLEKADGPTSQANLNAVNLAKSVRDGEKIIIPANKSTKSAVAQDSTVTSADGLININTASAKMLQQLSGIGPALAGRIIKYRKEHNSFQSKEELTKVSGIGSKTLAKLKEQITY